MSGRDELAGLLFTTDNSKAVSPWSEWEHAKQEPRLSEYVYAMADAILAAGYGPLPTTVTEWGVASKWGRHAYMTKELALDQIALHHTYGENAKLVKRAAATAPGAWEEAE